VYNLHYAKIYHRGGLVSGHHICCLYFSQLEQILATLQRANPWYLALAIVIQAMWFAVVGLTYHSIYSLLGLKESRRHMILLAVAANFVNVVTTSAGVGGMALFINDGSHRGQSSGRVTVAGALYLLVDEAAFLCVLALGAIILARRQSPERWRYRRSIDLVGDCLRACFFPLSWLSFCRVIGECAGQIGTHH